MCSQEFLGCCLKGVKHSAAVRGETHTKGCLAVFHGLAGLSKNTPFTFCSSAIKTDDKQFTDFMQAQEDVSSLNENDGHVGRLNFF